MEKLSLTDPVSVLSGVGTARKGQLAEMGINTIGDLLYHAPFRYEKVEKSVKITELQIGSIANFEARVVSKIPIKTRRFRHMIKVKVSDETGALDLTWFNTPFILSSLVVGESYFFTGKVGDFHGKPAITNPTVERQAPSYGSLVPIYHESADINSRFFRKLINEALLRTDLKDDSNFKEICIRHDLVDLKTALSNLHEPKENDADAQKVARKRLAFDEMFALIYGVLKRKTEHQKSVSTAKLKTTNTDIENFAKLLPYPLTTSQRSAIQGISLDLVQPHPMQRLIQGEVGSGKTTVAAFALLTAAKQKSPALFICPTKILASQHFETLTKLFGEMENPPRLGLYTGKQKEADADILVGTHALFKLKSIKPSLVVIDEEHRFGVDQRETFFRLKKKPHLLSMTATPIPRTVALTALADQEISYIEPHKNNDNIKTWVTPLSKRTKAYAWMKQTLKESGGQAIIVCPFIEESYIETFAAVKSAKKEFESLKKIFAGLKLELLHGKIKEEDKQKVFDKMMSGKTNILVTTPVVEVGVDIAGANIIVIEGAERFGLAQLHQLRGRVGRRGQNAYCLLFTTSETDGTKRLEHFAKTYDGNSLAEYDLKHRGSGELLGTAQHGFDTLKFASWFDTKLIEICRKEASLFLERKD